MQQLDWRDEHKFEGKFWLPSAPENRVAGRLTIKGGTFPSLSTLSPLLPNGNERPEYLLGSIRTGDVSLVGCALMTREALQKTEFSGQKIAFDGLLLGRHASPQNFARRLRLRFTNVRRLSATSVWTFERGTPTSKPDHVTVHVRTEEHVLAVEHEGTKIDIRVSAPVNASRASRGDELTVKPEVDVDVTFPQLTSVSEARRFWDDLKLFWSVMTGTRSDLISVMVSDESPADDNQDENAMSPYLGVVPSDAADAEAFGDFLYDLTRGTHPGKLAEVLRTWLQRRGELRLGARLLVDTWNRSVSWESKLGVIAQALEAFHRVSSHRQLFIGQADYEPIQQELEDRISALTADPDLRTSLKKRVEFGNQLSLRRRTKDLMRVMPPGLRDAFGKWQLLADEMVLARNTIIHRDPSSPPPSFRETVRIAGHFGLTVHVALAQAIGVPDDVIDNRLQMQPPYQEWLSYRR